MSNKKKFYAVAKGRQMGIYNDWDMAERQVKGVPCLFKGFTSFSDAVNYMADANITKIPVFEGQNDKPARYIDMIARLSSIKKQPEPKEKTEVLEESHCFNTSGTETFTIEYVVDKVIFSNPDTNFYIFSIKKIKLPEGENLRSPSPIAKGEFPQEVREGDNYKSLVKWVFQDKYGWQFDCKASFPIAPANIRGIKRFLRRFIPGVGTKTIDAIISAFGVNAITKMKEGSEVIESIEGIGKKKAEKIYKKIKENDCIEELAEYLFLRGITNFMTVVRIFEELGNSAVSMIQANPYILVEKINSSCLPIAEQIAMENHIDYYDLGRIECMLMTYINGKTFLHGDTYVPYEVLRQNFGAYVVKKGCYPTSLFDCEKFGVALKNALLSLKKQKQIELAKIGDDNVIYPYALYQSELYAASGIHKLLDDKEQELASPASVRSFLEQFEKENDIQIDEMQKQAIYNSLGRRMSVITGGPGTGKTMTVNILIQSLHFVKPNINVCLAAPTGRAAKRMTELSGMPALTLHRLLGLNGREEVDIKALELSEPCDVLIVDEFSMTDILLFSKLMSAVQKEKIWLIIVGDVDQLPSVGPGMVLRDLIDSGIIPVTRLSTLFRQAELSQIATTAHSINEGICFGDGGIEIDKKRGDFYFFQAKDEMEYKTRLLDIIQYLINKGQSADDITVLSPMRKGFVGSNQLNPLIRDILNPPHPDRKELICNTISFRVGDRVMQVVNNYDLGDTGVFNGEIGVVTYIDTQKHRMTVRYPDIDKEYMDIEYKGAALYDLELAYSVSIHKSQGSEMPIVIMPAIWYNNYTKNLLYTGLTRAKETIIFIGNVDDINRVIQTQGISRLSGLRYRLENTKDA